jgi:hypothetical protein
MKNAALFQLLALALISSTGFAAAAKPKTPAKPGDYKGLKHDKIPSNAYGVFSFEDAQKEAVKKKKPLVLLYAEEEKDGDAALVAAGVKAFWALEDDAMVVVLHAKTAKEWKRLPESIQAGMKSPDLGKVAPRLLAVTDDATTLLAGMASPAIAELDQKNFDKFGKEIKKLNAIKTPSADYPPPNPAAVAAAKPAATPPTTKVKPAVKADVPPVPASTAVAGPVTIKNPQSEAWTNAEGKVIQAALVEVNGDAIVLEMGGKKVPYDLSKLSEPSKKRVAELRAANAK